MKSIHFLFACLLFGSIGFAQAQNPIVNKKTFQYSDQGTEYLFSKENWNIGNSLDTFSYTSKEFQYFEEIGQTLPSKDIFTHYFEDSSVTQRVLHFPTLRENPGLALLRGREVKIPALQTRASIDSIWSYDSSGVAQLDYRRISIKSPNQEGYILEDYKEGQIWQETQRYMRETRDSLDRNGCLLVRKQLLNGEIRERIDYQLDSDCKVEEEYICRKDYRGNVLSLDTLQHYIDGNFYIRENRNGNFKEVKEISTGRIVEIVEAASFSDRIDRTLFNVYTHLDSNISTIHTFRRYDHDTTWRRHEWIKSIEIPQKYKHTFEGHSWNARFQKWEEIRFSEKIYDREGDIVFSINYISFLNRNLGYLIPDLGIEYNYRYERSFDCEGLLQEKKAFYNNRGNLLIKRQERFEYAYLDPSDCEKKDEGISVYPNPVQHHESITITRHTINGIGHFRLLDITGRVVREVQQASTEASSTIATAGMMPGIYVVQQNLNGSWETKKKLWVR